MRRLVSFATVLLVLNAPAVFAGPSPANLTELECAIVQFAAMYASAKLPAAANQSIIDALNVAWVCANVTTEPMALELYASLEREQARHAAARAAVGARILPTASAGAFYVSTTGSDTNPGTLQQPFATLTHAAAVIRAAGPRAPASTVVYVRAGTYYMGGDPLILSEADSNVTWAAYPTDAPAPVILSGGIELSSLSWQPWGGGVSGIQVAAVNITDARRAAWMASHGGATPGRAGPPPLVASLFVNGVRQVRARYPNGNPQDGSGICFYAATQRPGEGCDGWSKCALGPTGNTPGAPGIRVNGFGPDRGDSPTMGCSQCGRCGSFGYTVYPPPADHPVYNQPLPGVGWSNTSIFSPFGTVFTRPAGLQLAVMNSSCDAHWGAVNYSNPTDAVVHMFHPEHWGGWMYAVDNVTLTASSAQASNDLMNVNFGYGGYQEARGGKLSAGQLFYLENVLEELDIPGEWFYDAAAGQLYVYPNGTDLSKATITVPVADAVIIVNGSQTAPTAYARNISFTGFVITQSRVTFLEQYEVPSGGDWAVHRGAALVVQDSEDITIANCTFDQTGGNGVIFSNHVTGSSVTDSEFHYTGDSAVILLGSTISIDGSAPTYPNRNTIARNHMHEIGLYGKQTSCIGLQLSANTTMLDNVCYNGPRAGINFNDGFGGGNVFEGNVVWNMVRETHDHGPVNSWDRQPYWTFSGVDDGFNDPQGRSFIRAEDYNRHNLIINGYNGIWTFDHDDCSQFVSDEENFMVFGGCKNNLGDTKLCKNNVILYPGIDGRSAGNKPCQTDNTGTFANSYHTGNTCTTADGVFYQFNGCSTVPDTLNTTVYRTGNNTLYADVGSVFSQKCNQTVTFQQWQALDQDVNSTTGVTPPVSTLVALGAAVLGL